ncbi:hypothetical protein DUNSADRAFT_5985 [Dunaliella salina]|uniref:Encoded protein n=1 Tax=Dunaliella salina TaxID=3046 RepID=A0ABQ7GP86_DUNSA|nr:hypothetical protein DUNSADRAFT_5985 [Dunaliella salina]KAF5836416.1 hypothetical protein DUNSADRAFT_5985 [Dunaliella salina]|eukprot:KAF5836415.1 hypothetical protein DUNSADRAFT_5985 [Dunaliella salina]
MDPFPPSPHASPAPLACAGLLLRLSHEGDVALQPMAREHAAADAAQVTQQQQQGDVQHELHSESASHIGSLVPPPDFGDVHYKLLTRYPNLATAHRLILGRKGEGCGQMPP